MEAPYPPRFVDLKREIAQSVPDFERHVTQAWTGLLSDLERATEEISSRGSEIVPSVNFGDLKTLSAADVANIKRRGCVVVRDVVDDAEATGWQTSLKEFVRANPSAPGFPADKQFFELYWTKPQVLARSHPNVLATCVWLNNLYHTGSGETPPGVDLSTPLTYADRFRMRHPGGGWNNFPPHVDGGSIERWEDPAFRSCYLDILKGEIDKHDPYDLRNRLDARTSLYGRPNQTSIFRTFQGWLAMSETGPTEGTLQVFPDVHLSNAYIMLRPFFRLKEGTSPEDQLSPGNWEFDLSQPDFPGLYWWNDGWVGPLPRPETHPHLRLGQNMTSVPKVFPGDMVFWHCDVMHAVESDHTGIEDSSVMYIPAVPTTPHNSAYVARQKEAFLTSMPPEDYPKSEGEASFVGIGKPGDITGELGKVAMGLLVDAAA